jgi:hypothetical protein
MRLQELASRLVVVETKLATLTGVEPNTTSPTSIEELDSRLSVVEVQVDRLLAEKAERQVAEVVAAPADKATVSVADIVALSASSNVPQAADIVADVVAVQMEAPAIQDPEVAAIVTAAIKAVVNADPEVVTDPEAVRLLITDVVSQMPAPSADVEEKVAAAVAEVVSAATGEDVTPEVHAEIKDAVITQSDAELDAIEARLNAAEAKVDSLLGK